MQKLRILRRIMRQTGAEKILISFVAFVLFCAFIIWIWEPGINSYLDALWYCYAVVTTIGFGDVVTKSLIARVLSVMLSIYAVLVIAIITGVVVNYYNEMTALRNQKSIAAFLDKVERLPELSKEEIEDLSNQVRRFRMDPGDGD